MSGDGDDRRILLGLKLLSILFFFLAGGVGRGGGRVEKFGKHVFGWLDLSRDFWGSDSKQSEDSW